MRKAENVGAVVMVGIYRDERGVVEPAMNVVDISMKSARFIEAALSPPLPSPSFANRTTTW